MIGKQTKGTSFGGCVRYVLKEEKTKLLEAVGVEGTPEQMAEQFELQSLLNDKVKNIVGHTSLNFSPEDRARLKSDDTLLLSIAHNYMQLMGIVLKTRNTSLPDISTVSIRIAISFSTEWTMTARRLATRMISAGMKKSAKC